MVCWCSPGKPCECACCKGKPPLPPGVAPRPERPPIKITAKEFRDEIKRQTGVEYSLSHSYALLASLRRRKPRDDDPSGSRGGTDGHGGRAPRGSPAGP